MTNYSGLEVTALFATLFADNETVKETAIAVYGEQYACMDSVGLEPIEVLDMTNWFGTALDAVEEHGNENGLLSSESEVSEAFDSDLSCEQKRDLGSGVHDMFTNWCDARVTEGHLHPVQYSNYNYVGELL